MNILLVDGSVRWVNFDELNPWMFGRQPKLFNWW